MSNYDASNRQHVKLAQKQAKEDDLRRRDFIIHIMSSVEGRAWMCGVLENCHVFANCYTSSDRRTAFLCGEQNVGQQHLADIMRRCPDQYILMMRERNERDISSDTARNRLTPTHGADRTADSGGNATDYDPFFRAPENDARDEGVSVPPE